MKYYFIKILTEKETKATKKSVYEYEDEKTARANLYSGYASALNDSTICQVLCMLIDEYGSVLETLTWIDPSEPVTEPTTEPEVVAESN